MSLTLSLILPILIIEFFCNLSPFVLYDSFGYLLTTYHNFSSGLVYMLYISTLFLWYIQYPSSRYIPSSFLAFWYIILHNCVFSYSFLLRSIVSTSAWFTVSESLAVIVTMIFFYFAVLLLPLISTSSSICFSCLIIQASLLVTKKWFFVIMSELW